MAIAMLMSRGTWPLRAGLLIPVLAMAALGLAEDVGGVPVGRRFALQLVIGPVGAPLLLHGAGLRPTVAVGAAVIGVLWLVAFVNAFNFMDGINGISAMEAAVAGLTYAWLGRGRSPILVDGGIIVAAAAIAFVPFNFPHARMFLGDVGSYLLGAWLAVLAVLTIRDRFGLVAAVAPLALYLGDTGITLLRRVAAREPWHQPHRSHAYQRLVQAGCSHTFVTLFVGAIVAICSVLGVVARGRALGVQVGIAAAIVAIVVAYIGVSWGRPGRPGPAVA